MDMKQQFIITIPHQTDSAHRLKHIILRTQHFGEWLILCTQLRGNKKQPVFNTWHGNNPLGKINNNQIWH
jgi:hypothetical protein